jgi:hypothetical protein
MLRKLSPSSSSYSLSFAASATAGSISSTLLLASTRSHSGTVTHFRDSKEAHPLRGVIPGVRRDGKREILTDNDGRDFYYEYPCEHEIWSEEECRAVRDDTRPRRTFLDSSAYWTIQAVRLGFDVASGYKFGKLNKAKILRRVLFLECAAGIPGAVAGTLRHLKSLRTMKRDHGWIQTLLSEAENERMHMLVAQQMHHLRIGKPGFLMRFCVLMTQGVMWNGFFISYILTNGKFCHRLVGHLEESACHTYKDIIAHLEDPANTELHAWGKEAAPEIAINYWKLKKDATVVDVFLQILADEDNHKKVNHALADVGPDSVNPYVSHEEAHRSLQEQIEEDRRAAAAAASSTSAEPKAPRKHDADPYWTEEELGNKPKSSTNSFSASSSSSPYTAPHASSSSSSSSFSAASNETLSNTVKSSSSPDKNELFTKSVSYTSVGNNKQ